MSDISNRKLILGSTSAYRRELLAQGRLKEAVIPVERLAQAQGLAFFNGLRGWLDATLEPAAPPA